MKTLEIQVRSPEASAPLTGYPQSSFGRASLELSSKVAELREWRDALQVVMARIERLEEDETLIQIIVDSEPE